MKLNLKNIWILLLVIAVGAGSYFLGKCGVTENCKWYQIFEKYSFTVLEPILLYSIAATPLAIALIFVKGESFKKWLRFASWWLPLSVLLIAIAPRNSNSWMPFLEPTKEGLAWITGGLFTIISLVIIVRSNRTSRTRKKP